MKAICLSLRRQQRAFSIKFFPAVSSGFMRKFHVYGTGFMCFSCFTYDHVLRLMSAVYSLSMASHRLGNLQVLLKDVGTLGSNLFAFKRKTA